MDKPIVSTLPARQPKRKYIFAIRLTDAEHRQIETLAERLKLPDSFMARHFILEAVKHHSIDRSEGAEVDG
jgi:predicted transcriptional regulator